MGRFREGFTEDFIEGKYWVEFLREEFRKREGSVKVWRDIIEWCVYGVLSLLSKF